MGKMPVSGLWITEWVNFVVGEFNRLDTNQDGELDLKELTLLRMQYRPAFGN